MLQPTTPVIVQIKKFLNEKRNDLLLKLTCPTLKKYFSFRTLPFFPSLPLKKKLYPRIL
jgi:hypothetical protein